MPKKNKCGRGRPSKHKKNIERALRLKAQGLRFIDIHRKIPQLSRGYLCDILNEGKPAKGA